MRKTDDEEHCSTIKTAPEVSVLFGPMGARLGCGRSQVRWKIDEASDILFLILAFCQVGRRMNDVVSIVSDYCSSSQQAANDVITKLLNDGLLISGSGQESLQQRWRDFGWRDAMNFHLATSRLPTLDYNAGGWNDDVQKMLEYQRAETPPSTYRELGNLPRTGLPGVDLEQIRLSDYRNPTTSKIETISVLLKLCFGKTGRIVLPITGEHITKTSPSGGSRHPTECLVLTRGIAGLPDAAYWYDVSDHCLRKPKGSKVVQETLHAALGLEADRVGFPPTIILVLTTVFDRSMYRYRSSRSYRVLMHDVGHLLDTTRQVAEAMGLAFYSDYSLVDCEQIERFADIRSLEESALTYMAIG